jgi:hypothetical protein
MSGRAKAMIESPRVVPRRLCPSSGDDEILTACHIRHWRRLAAGREIGAPELDAALYIEGPNMIVHGCDKDEAAASDDRTTQTRHALDEAAVGREPRGTCHLMVPAFISADCKAARAARAMPNVPERFGKISPYPAVSGMAEFFWRGGISPSRRQLARSIIQPRRRAGALFPFRMTRLKTTRGSDRNGASQQPRHAKRAR